MNRETDKEKVGENVHLIRYWTFFQSYVIKSKVWLSWDQGNYVPRKSHWHTIG